MTEDQSPKGTETALLGWQSRVIIEKEELDEKAAKLAAFIAKQEDNPETKVPSVDLLKRQHAAMLIYSSILGERIAGF